MIDELGSHTLREAEKSTIGNLTIASGSVSQIKGNLKYICRPIKLVPEYSNRVSALNPGSMKLLERIGAWDIISEQRFNPVYSMQVSTEHIHRGTRGYTI